MQLFKKFYLIYELMDRSDKRKLLLILIISMVNGVLSAATIASILPFIGLVSEPEILNTNEYIVAFSRITGIESYSGVVISFGLIGFSLLIAGNAISAFDSWYGELFGAKKDQVLSTRLLRNYLHIDVLEFERRNSAERAKEILSDVDRVIISTLFSMLDLVSEVIISLCVIGLLFWVDWGVTLVVAVVLITAHFLVNSLVSAHLARLGKRHAELESTLFSHVLEALKLHKEIKLNDISGYFVNRYAESSGEMVRNGLKRSLISELPQYVLEVIAFGVILAVAIYFAVFSGNNGQPVTIIGMYAVAAYRLVPSIASIFDRVEDIWFDTAILEDFVGSLTPLAEDDLSPASDQKIKRSISLKDVCFKFGASSPFHMDALNLEFPVNRFTCIKGRTGCGKSTVLNLLAGLYRPSSGRVVADGKAIDANRCAWWKRRIGLVPADVNVIQISLYENIALGIEPSEIDREKVRRVCGVVDLDELIGSLNHGYESIYGENGLNFSSGQIQKVGIARALYRDPALLLLDESTDAFDLKTEQLVLDRLKAIDGMTMVFVSHRPSVMEHADVVIDLEEVLQDRRGAE